MRPFQNPVKPLGVLFLDAQTGAGYTMNGHLAQAPIGEGRSRATLMDFLELADNYDPMPQMIVLTGGTPPPGKDGKHWTTAETPGWEHGNHWIDGENVTGRYTRDGRTVSICVARNWFGDVPVDARQAKEAWRCLTYLLKDKSEGKMNLMMTPSRTGAFLWGFAITKKFNPPSTDGYINELIHSTSGQGHIEHLVAGDYASHHPDCVPLIDPAKTPTIGTFAHIDGRFMYASVCKELGTGPIHELRQDAAADLWRDSPYHPARYRVSVQVPEDWDHIGILGLRDEEDRSNWFYPNRPGARFETWASNRELIVAQKWGWGIQPLEGLSFTKGMRPLDTMADWIIDMRAKVEKYPEQGHDPVAMDAAMTALRAILLHGIGRFASRGRPQMRITDDIDSVPAEAVGTIREMEGGQFSYRTFDPMAEKDLPYYHPELASQVWGWARANVLDANTKNGRTGALHVNPRTLIGIQTDAIYTSELPRWAAPVAKGGADDGEAGRLRLKGVAWGEFKTPETLEERDALKKIADSADLSTAWSDYEHE